MRRGRGSSSRPCLRLTPTWASLPPRVRSLRSLRVAPFLCMFTLALLVAACHSVSAVYDSLYVFVFTVATSMGLRAANSSEAAVVWSTGGAYEYLNGTSAFHHFWDKDGPTAVTTIFAMLAALWLRQLLPPALGLVRPLVADLRARIDRGSVVVMLLVFVVTRIARSSGLSTEHVHAVRVHGGDNPIVSASLAVADAWSELRNPAVGFTFLTEDEICANIGDDSREGLTIWDTGSKRHLVTDPAAIVNERPCPFRIRGVLADAREPDKYGDVWLSLIHI